MGCALSTPRRVAPRCAALPQIFLLLSLTLGCTSPEPDSAGDRRAQARIVAEESMEAMGGWENWNATRYIRFSFFGFRTHHWDKGTGRYRVSWTDRESGQFHVVLMNLNTRDGKAFADGTEVTDGEARNRLLERAWDAWINDTYWLLMPYKLQDPGVDLVYAGEEAIDGVVFDKLHLSFQNVGNTPDDEYWAYINRETRLMEKWVYLLQLREGQDERTRGEWKWNDWRRYGDILLSAEREKVDGQKRYHEDLAVFEHLSDLVFTSPLPVSPEMLQENAVPGAFGVSDTSGVSHDTRPSDTQPADTGPAGRPE